MASFRIWIWTAVLISYNKYRTRHGLVGKVTHWELCKNLKFVHADKLYAYKPESLLENDMYTIIWDFAIQTDPLVLARKTDLVLSRKFNV